MTFFSGDLSALFRENSNHVSRATVEVGGEVIDDTFYGGGSIGLEANGSSVSYDRLSPARSRARLTLWAKGESARQALNPVNRPKVTVHAGVDVDGTVTWHQLGVFHIESRDETKYEEWWSVAANCVDLSEAFRTNKWDEPFKTGGGTFKAAMQAIVTDRDPGGLFDHQLWLHEYTTENAPDLHYTESDDPWAALMELARSSESELYFSKAGFLVHEEIPDPTTASPVYTLGGDDFQVEVGRRKGRLSIRNVFNGVIVRGEAPWLLFPISGEYWDDDPASATYRLGDFGERAKVIGSPIATTNAHCATIAEAEFRRIAGITEEITFGSFKDPVLSVADVVRVDGTALATSGTAPGLYTVDRMNYPLGAQHMTATVRRKSV